MYFPAPVTLGIPLLITSLISVAAVSTPKFKVPVTYTAKNQPRWLNRTTTLNTTLLAGASISGFEFGCDNQGRCDLSAIDPPVLHIPPYNSVDASKDGAAQMAHFVQADRLNVFRLPVSWQYLTNNTLGDGAAIPPLNPTNYDHYDRLVRSCLATGAWCQLDVHNYGRWQGAIIGAQGGPTDEQFAALWGALAARYAGDARVWFGVMNEPHDMGFNASSSSDDATSWAATVQAAVTAIRGAGAAAQLISLPGAGWQTPGALLGSAARRGEALARVVNPDGSAEGLVFDVHLYLDADGSGTHQACVTDGVAGSWAPLAAWLRAKGRRAVVSETGGGDSPSCLEFVCRALDYFNENSDVYLGYLLWAAGSFQPTYALSLTQYDRTTSSWRDSDLMNTCMAR